MFKQLPLNSFQLPAYPKLDWSITNVIQDTMIDFDKRLEIEKFLTYYSDKFG